MILHLPTCLALHNTNVHSTRAMLAFCPASKTFSLFPALEKPPLPTHLIFSQSFSGFSFNITSLRKLPLIVQAVLPLSHVCFHRSLYFSFIDIITYLKYIIHLMLVSVGQQNLSRKRSCSCLSPKFLLQCFTVSSFSVNIHLMNSLNNAFSLTKRSYTG